MGKIQDLPKYDRPREKARRFGIDKLSNEELIALLLGTGTKELSVMDLSHQLLDESHGLVNLFTKPYTALLSVHDRIYRRNDVGGKRDAASIE